MFLTILAQSPAGSPSASPQNGLGGLLFFLPIIAIAYFLMIRPQSRARKQQVMLVTSIEIGDEIETAGGLYGTVRRMDETAMWIEFSPGNTVKVARAAVRRKILPDPPSETGTE
jgi:preprotein translocase subunit YajC